MLRSSGGDVVVGIEKTEMTREEVVLVAVVVVVSAVMKGVALVEVVAVVVGWPMVDRDWVVVVVADDSILGSTVTAAEADGDVFVDIPVVLVVAVDEVVVGEVVVVVVVVDARVGVGAGVARVGVGAGVARTVDAEIIPPLSICIAAAVRSLVKP